MLLAFSTNAYTRVPASAGAARAFARRDLRRSKFWPMCRMHIRLRSRMPGRSVAEELRRLGLAVSNVNVNCSFGYWKDAPPEPYFEPSLISPNPRHRDDRIELIGNAMEFAQAVGAPTSASPAAGCSAACRPTGRPSNSSDPWPPCWSWPIASASTSASSASRACLSNMSRN